MSIETSLSPLRLAISAHMPPPPEMLIAERDAIRRSQAVVELTPDGVILDANDRFLTMMGYLLDEIVGRHHRLFVEPGQAGHPAYADFWCRLARGEFVAAEFKRVRKNGDAVWIQGSYNPVLDAHGRPIKIVKFSTDITAAKMKSADDAGQIAAIGRSQAVITFSPDGVIWSANEHFCTAIGHREADIVGRHHSIFVTPQDRESPAYAEFWRALRDGSSQAGEFCRIGRDGGEVWLNATYTPILDPEGKVFKIVKFATDITQQVAQREKFNLLSLVADGTDNSVVITDPQQRIIYVNVGFERLTGYTLQDVVGKKPGHLLQGRHTDRATIERIRARLAAGEAFYEEIMNYDRGGRPYWISLAINPVRGADGRIERFISIQANITETKQRAIEFNARLAAINAATAIAEWAIDGTWLSANSVLDGHAPVPLTAILTQADIALILRGDSVRREILWPNGARFWIDAMFAVVRDIEGAPQRLLMCAIDITPRRAIVADASQAMHGMLDHVTAMVGELDKITRTTRLLSLNARIEAARAAEAGEGFAVVADEVCSLANQAGHAATTIRSLVSDSRNQIERLIAGA